MGHESFIVAKWLTDKLFKDKSNKIKSPSYKAKKSSSHSPHDLIEWYAD